MAAFVAVTRQALIHHVPAHESQGARNHERDFDLMFRDGLAPENET